MKRSWALLIAILVFSCVGVGQAFAFDEVSHGDLDFYHEIKKSILADDIAWLKTHIDYPIDVIIDGAFHRVANQQDFEKNYDKIVNIILKKCVMNSTAESLHKNYLGVWISNGCIWFDYGPVDVTKRNDRAAWRYSIFSMKNWKILPPGLKRPPGGKRSPEG